MSESRTGWIGGALVLLVVLGAVFYLLSGESESPELTPEQAAPAEVETPRAEVRPLAPIHAVPFDRKADRSTSTFVLSGEETGISVNGLVTDEAGRGIANATVDLVQDLSALKTRFQEGDVLGTIRTNAAGEFRFENLTPGDIHVIRAGHADWTMARVHPIDAADPATLNPVLVLKQGFSIAGSVRGTGGEPLEGAVVEVHDLSVQSFEPVVPPECSARSGPDGTYTVKHVSEGLKKLIVRCQGRAMDGRNAVDVRGPLTNIDFVMDTGLSITGVVLDGITKQPIPNAVITARPLNFLVAAAPGVEVHSGGGDSEVTAEMKARESARRVAAGLTPHESAMEVNPGRQLQPQQIVTKAFLLGDAKSDAEGRFRLEGLLSARYLLIVRCRGFQPNNGFAADAGAEEVQVQLSPSASVSGRVVHADTGEPVTRFSVALSAGPDPMYITAQMRQRFNHPNGEFTYLDARPGTVVLIAESEGFAGGRSDPMNLSADQRIDGVVVRLEKGATISGTVLAVDGRPVSGARVSLNNASQPVPDNPFTRVLTEQLRSASRKRAVTAVDGSWSIPGVLGGSYKASSEHTNFVAAESAEISCDGRGEVSVPPIRMSEGGVLKGVVRRKDGTPDPQATVMVRCTEPGTLWSRSVTTASDGGYELRGLKPGAYSVVATQRGGQVDLMEILRRAQDPGALVQVAEGQTSNHDL